MFDDNAVSDGWADAPLATDPWAGIDGGPVADRILAEVGDVPLTEDGWLDPEWVPPFGELVTQESFAARRRVGIYHAQPGEVDGVTAVELSLGGDELPDPAHQSVGQRRLVRPLVASITSALPGPAQLCEVSELLEASARGVALTRREWVEVAAALDRLSAHVDAAKLVAVAELDRVAVAAKPSSALGRDTRRLAADELAPALRVAPATASRSVGLARRLFGDDADLPLAADAPADGRMTLAQLTVLAGVTRRLPPEAARVVETIAVRKAATLVRGQLAAAIEEAAVQADPAYAARRTADGIAERDVRLAPSPTPGCRRLVADLEMLDAAAVWQVLNAVAKAAQGDLKRSSRATAGGTDDEAPVRTLPQLRADALVSLIVGMFSPTVARLAEEAAEAAHAQPGAECDDDPDDGDDADDPDDGESQPASVPPAEDLLPEPDTRGPVDLPTPEQRTRLAEVHVVVLADDIPDASGPDDASPDGSGPGDPGPDHPGPGGERPDDQGPVPDAGPDTGHHHGAGAGDRPERALARHGPFGWVPGIGRLAPLMTREALLRAPWRRLVADPVTGTLRERSPWTVPAEPSGRPSGSTTRRLALLRAQPADGPPAPEVAYRPSSTLAAFVRARDSVCLGPACHHPARGSQTQLDHTVAFGAPLPGRTRGGATESANLGPLCQRTHTAKTHDGWELQQPEPGRFLWTSPAGRVYERGLAPLVPDLVCDLADEASQPQQRQNGCPAGSA